MSKSKRSIKEMVSNVPPALLIAVEVPPVHIAGHYDKESQTWSNRDFETASQKKHNEEM